MSTSESVSAFLIGQSSCTCKALLCLERLMPVSNVGNVNNLLQDSDFKETVNFRFAPCGLVVLTVLPQSFKNGHFPPIVYYVFFPFCSPPLTPSKVFVN
ncbi:hypothetical protein Hanom_Chr10g00923771 [Helianthus anomalus]